MSSSLSTNSRLALSIPCQISTYLFYLQNVLDNLRSSARSILTGRYVKTAGSHKGVLLGMSHLGRPSPIVDLEKEEWEACGPIC